MADSKQTKLPDTPMTDAELKEAGIPARNPPETEPWATLPATQDTPVAMPGPQTQATGLGSVFFDPVAFEQAQRAAKMFSHSQLVPDHIRGNIADCVVALALAQEMNVNPLVVMQAIYFVHGKPSWSAQFMISRANQSPRIDHIRFEMTGKEGSDDRACQAWAIDQSTGEEIRGPRVSIAMANREGWVSKKGSKWQTMPELMLKYRAATFFVRTEIPEVMMGYHTTEELRDVGTVETVVVESAAPPKTGMAGVAAALDG